ncbi:unnamed protein product [Sympodiomycopsis kandeliae]
MNELRKPSLCSTDCCSCDSGLRATTATRSLAHLPFDHIKTAFHVIIGYAFLVYSRTILAFLSHHTADTYDLRTGEHMAFGQSGSSATNSPRYPHPQAEAEGIPMTPLTTSNNSTRAGTSRSQQDIAESAWSWSSLLDPNPIITFSLSFFLLGLLNNSLYVVILTSALELLPKGVPTGLVALANIGPALIAKGIWPYALKGRVRYARRITSCTILSTLGMLIIAFLPSLSARLIGISMASFSSGLGELTFLQLCTRYGTVRAGRGVGWFASGTGAAGLFGAGAWWIVRPLGVKGGLSIMSLLPLFMAAAYFVLLPDVDKMKEFETNAILNRTTRAQIRGQVRGDGYQPVARDQDDEDDDSQEELDGDEEDALNGTVADQVAAQSNGAPVTLLPRGLNDSIIEDKRIKLSMEEKISLLKPMLIPFILPLVLVYLFEYTINQGIAPTLLYPIPSASKHLLLSWMIKNLKDYYPLYQLTYQTFVFLSRSSISILHIPPIPKSLLWVPAIVQLAILFLLTSESLYFWFRDSIARSLVIVLVGMEGLAGGWAYVSVFYQIGTTQQQRTTDHEQGQEEDDGRRGQEQEFRVGCVGVGDSMGILIASLISMPIQLGLCDAQVQMGRDLCKQI